MQKAQNFFNKIVHSIVQRKLKPAFDTLEKLLEQANDWNLYEQLEISKRTYKTMLYYLAKNSRDPEREIIYQTLSCSLFRMADVALWQIKLIDNHSFLCKKRKFYLFNNLESSEELLTFYGRITKKISLSNFSSKEEKEILMHKKENIYYKIFPKIWLSDHWTNNERKQWTIILCSPKEIVLACLIISAVTLNLLETFDEEKVNLLLEISKNEKCNEIRERALIGLILIIRKYNYRLHLYKKIVEQFYVLIETSSTIKIVRQILLQFISCKGTEQITRKITDKLLPEIMRKIEGNVDTKFRLVNSLLEDNEIGDKAPEWSRLVESIDIEKRLNEISELQKEGEDVMYSSFIYLKNYPFFEEISHWFIPFASLSETRKNPELTDLIELLKTSSFLCNSDKYSLYLNVFQMPGNIRNNIIKQFSSELEDLKGKELVEKINYLYISNPIRQYIQDLYRFYKLYPNKNEFEDIFDVQPEFYKVPWIFFFIKDIDSLSVIGEYYFHKNCFDEAADIYDKILQNNSNNDVLYQKIGFCMQMKGQFQTALELYQKAELINSNHSWTIKKIAYLYRILKNPKEALYYYKKAEQLNPENLNISLNIGNCYLELKIFEKALKYYFKVEYLSQDKEKIWRLIGWCSFLMKDYSQAIYYFNKVMKINPNTTDFLNLGHTQLVSGNIMEAIRLYQLAIKNSNSSYEDFVSFFYNDVPVLNKSGISMETISFIIDSCYFL